MKKHNILIIIVALVIILSACTKKEYFSETKTQQITANSKEHYEPLKPKHEWKQALGKCIDNPVDCLEEIVIKPEPQRVQRKGYTAFLQDVLSGNQNIVSRWFSDGSYLNFMPQIEEDLITKLSSGKYHFHYLPNNTTGTDYIIVSTEKEYNKNSPVLIVFQFTEK